MCDDLLHRADAAHRQAATTLTQGLLNRMVDRLRLDPGTNDPFQLCQAHVQSVHAVERLAPRNIHCWPRISAECPQAHVARYPDNLPRRIIFELWSYSLADDEPV